MCQLYINNFFAIFQFIILCYTISSNYNIIRLYMHRDFVLSSSALCESFHLLKRFRNIFWNFKISIEFFVSLIRDAHFLIG